VININTYRPLCLLGFMIFVPSLLFAQHHEHNREEQHQHPVFLIDRAAGSGIITQDQALVEKFRAIYAPEKLDPAFKTGQPADPKPLKCFTPALIEYRNLKNTLDQQVIAEIDSYQNATASTALSFTHTSPSGRFVISYDTTGSNAVPTADINNNAVPDYVEKAGDYADAAYQKEIEQMGFTDPIPAGATYSIRIHNSSAYGFTQTSSSEPAGTFIVVENDYVGFPPNTDPEGDQLGALKVTIAHELKHAIQFSQNGWSGETDLWAEMDATLMEEVVYDEVNDYYNYIYDLNFGTPLFQTPASTLLPVNGNSFNYEDITWALFFHERFGENFWPATWSRIENDDALNLLEVVRQETENRGENYFHVLAESYLWHYASGSLRSAVDYGFDEREEYPEPTVEQTFVQLPKQPTTQQVMEPVSARFYEVVPENIIPDFVEVSLTHNTATAHMGLVAFFSDNSVETRFAQSSTEQTTTLRPGWEWSQIERLGIVVVSSNESQTEVDKTSFSLDVNATEITSVDDNPAIPQSVTLKQNYPNPFNPSTVIRFELSKSDRVLLRVFDINGRLIQTVANRVFGAGTQEVRFDGSNLSSGLYIYEISTGDITQNKKMLLIK